MKKKQEPLYEQALKQIEGQILSGAYRKGDLLPSEKELIETLGVSRITVRKALSILTEMGMIKTSKGRGSEVLFSMAEGENQKKFAEAAAEYREKFMASTQLRLLLEPEVARQAAARVTDEQLERLRYCTAHMDGEKSEEEFHLIIAETVGNKELVLIMRQLFQLEEVSAPRGLIEPSAQHKTSKILQSQHERIVDAMERKDGEFAYFYMKEHLRFVMQLYEEYFDRISVLKP